MLLEKYIDEGILLEQILHKARQGVEFKILNGLIEVNGKKYGVEHCDYTIDTLERAVLGATK